MTMRNHRKTTQRREAIADHAGIAPALKLLVGAVTFYETPAFWHECGGSAQGFVGR